MLEVNIKLIDQVIANGKSKLYTLVIISWNIYFGDFDICNFTVKSVSIC